MLKKALISVCRRCIHYIGVLLKFCRGIKCIFLVLKVFLRHGRVARKTSACLASASSGIEGRNHDHEVLLGLRVILIYNLSM